MTQEQIAELKSKWGDLISVDGHIFKRPSRAEYDRWVDEKLAEKPLTVPTRQLAQACLVTSWDDFIADLDRRPWLLLNEVLGSILELSGLGGEATKATVKKL